MAQVVVAEEKIVRARPLFQVLHVLAEAGGVAPGDDEHPRPLVHPVDAEHVIHDPAREGVEPDQAVEGRDQFRLGRARAVHPPHRRAQPEGVADHGELHRLLGAVGEGAHLVQIVAGENERAHPDRVLVRVDEPLAVAGHPRLEAEGHRFPHHARQAAGLVPVGIGVDRPPLRRPLRQDPAEGRIELRIDGDEGQPHIGREHRRLGPPLEVARTFIDRVEPPQFPQQADLFQAESPAARLGRGQRAPGRDPLDLPGRTAGGEKRLDRPLRQDIDRGDRPHPRHALQFRDEPAPEPARAHHRDPQVAPPLPQRLFDQAVHIKAHTETGSEKSPLAAPRPLPVAHHAGQQK